MTSIEILPVKTIIEILDNENFKTFHGNSFCP